jgi:methanogenic corrinoid protein MtbC1
MHVVYPFLQRIGVMWQAGSVNPAQEHLVTNLVRQKMMAATDRLASVQPTGAHRWVLFLPEGEMHELALLFMNYALRVRGHHVLYLGQNLPIRELQTVCVTYQPYALCTVMTAFPDRDRVQDFVDSLAALGSDKFLCFYGPLAHIEGLELPGNATRFRFMPEFLTLADKLRVGVESKE